MLFMGKSFEQILTLSGHGPCPDEFGNCFCMTILYID